MMNTSELVEWQRVDPNNGLVEPWLTHPFMEEIKKWKLGDKFILEFGGGRSTAWWRKECKWVDTIDASEEWANQSRMDCQSAGLYNGRILAKTLPDGIQNRKQEYFNLIPGDKYYDIIVNDGIWRYEVLQWALDHFKGRNGIIIADNWQQDFVWISPPSEELMKSYEIHKFVQPDHTNHEGKPWQTVFWNIPA